VGFALQGGYWDVDHVRLTESQVPNGSFELPQTEFADPRMDGWEKAPEPAWYTGGQQAPWDQLVGQFVNTRHGSSDHIDNLDGEQAAFLFALPDVAIWQDYDSTGGTGEEPAHAFDVTFEPGKAYTLTAGVFGGGGGMVEGATLEISLYYRDAESNQVTVVSTTVTNTAEMFPDAPHFVDVQVTMPPVEEEDAWAGEKVGIRLASTVGFEQQGGYWDLDNVRLEVLPAPVLTAPTQGGEGFQFTLRSPPGTLEIFGSSDPTLPLGSWPSLGVVSNLTGRDFYVDTNVASAAQFYYVRQVP
jgi:hypothetical protein